MYSNKDHSGITYSANITQGSHSERSEESTHLPRLYNVIRFFASLRMTTPDRVRSIAGAWFFRKRLFDLAAAAFILPALAPAFLFIAAAIRLDSPGPIFFRQKRLGLNGNVFSIFKFRTMVENAVSVGAKLVTFDGDPRVTKVGQILRKFRLDELPQLFNVLLGQMSLVGPRPLLPDYIDGYSERDMLRLRMPPGMTGWQQVNGGATHTWSERVESDIWYIEHWSPWLDIKILLKTPMVVLKADTVHGKDGWQFSGGPEDLLARKEAA